MVVPKNILYLHQSSPAVLLIMLSHLFSWYHPEFSHRHIFAIRNNLLPSANSVTSLFHLSQIVCKYIEQHGLWHRSLWDSVGEHTSPVKNSPHNKKSTFHSVPFDQYFYSCKSFSVLDQISWKAFGNWDRPHLIDFPHSYAFAFCEELREIYNLPFQKWFYVSFPLYLLY